MPLETTLVEIPFAKGVDQKSDPRHVGVGTQTSVINGSWAKSGSLRKRLGFNAVSKTSITASGNGPVLAAGCAVEAYKNAPIVSDGSNLYSYSTQKGSLLYEDQLPECIATRQPLTQSTSGITSSDCAATNGYALHVFRASDLAGTVKNYATIVDLSTNAQIGPNTILATSTKVGLRAFALGTDLWAVWTDSSNQIVASRFQTTGGTFQWVAPITLINTQDPTASAWDVCATVGASEFMVVYQDNGTPNRIHVFRFDQNGTSLANASFPLSGGSFPLVGAAIRATAGETAWISYVSTNGATTDFVRAFGIDPSTLVLQAGDSLIFSATPLSGRHVGIERVNSTTCVIVSSIGAGDVQWQQFNNAGGLVGPKRTQIRMQQWSKPFAVNGKVYCVFWHYSDVINQTFHVVDMCVSNTASDNSVARPVATIAPRIASQISSMDPLVSPNVWTIGNGKFIVPVTVSVSTAKDSVFQCTLDFASQQRHQAVEVGDCAYLAGGVPSIFDGAQVTEHGFLYPPPIATATASAGGSIDVGNHQYAVVYKRTNARGEVVRSAPTFTGVVATSGGNQTVTIAVPPYTLTTAQDAGNFWSPATTFDLYRNTVLDAATFWQVATDANETANDPRSTATVNIVDTISDAVLTGNAIGVLYTLGGVVASQCPPSLTCLTAHRSRIFGVGDDPTTLWYTAQYTPGFAPVWNDQLAMSCPDGGPITGLASMDDTLVIFKRDRIFRMGGTGPNNTAQQSDFTDLIRVSCDTGCTQSRSIVTTPLGIFFLSPQGIYALSRNGEAQYIGRAVEDTVAANPICLAADIVASRGEIRWSLAPSLPTDPTASNVTGVIVVYDYIQDSWSVHQYYDTDKTLASAVVMGARAPGGNWAWIGLGGQFYTESTTSYLDNGHWITLQVETANVKANGIGGWARFKRLFSVSEQKSPFQLSIDYAPDLSNTYLPGVTWTDTQIAARGSPMVELDFQLGIQKTQGVRFRLTDAAPIVAAVGTGQGPILLGNNLEVGLLPGSKGKRSGANQRG